MKNLLLFIILLSSINFYAQNSLEDKNIIESFLNGMFEKDFKEIEKIRIVRKFKNSKDFFYNEAISLKNEIDEIKKGLYEFPYNLLHGEKLKEKFSKNPTLMKSVYELVSNFNNHPKIEINKLNLKRNIKITSDSYSFLSNLFQHNKINTIRKMKFSRIQHIGNFATFYCSYVCGDICGYGGFMFMEKIDGKWIYIGTFEMWMS